ncbi:hypothetical protein PMI02_00617 [Novosphingobium sp. AP12]|nr:hypothetical protein PMI02_00617 [Novosphingobium sp. AP12]
MVMADGCEMMAEVDDRMPTILARKDWACWTDGTPGEAFALCRVYEGPIKIDRTPEPWFKARSVVSEEASFSNQPPLL